MEFLPGVFLKVPFFLPYILTPLFYFIFINSSLSVPLGAISLSIYVVPQLLSLPLSSVSFLPYSLPCYAALELGGWGCS